MKKNKLKKSMKPLLILTMVFISLFVVLLALSIFLTMLANPNIKPNEGSTTIDWFSTQVSNSNEMNVPFSIFIQLITTISGVFFGIRIDQWVDEKEKKEKTNSIWGRINNFLTKLKSGIDNDENIYGLAEYKIHWNSLLQVDNYSTQLLQEDDKYLDISFAFYFLTNYGNNWNNYENINQWQSNASTQVKERINNWKIKISELVEYTNGRKELRIGITR
jgi:hypothetical protein